MKKFKIKAIDEHQEILTKLKDPFYLKKIQNMADIISRCFKKGNKLLLCGNGGSAADCQHIAAEFMVKFEKLRVGYPAIALTTDTSILTAIVNDFGPDHTFLRQVIALANPGDILLAISTSGHSPNVLNAVAAARNTGCKTIALTGLNGKELDSLCDEAIMIPSDRTARIQEFHILIGHMLCEIIENEREK